MIISTAHNFIFIHIPKTAGVSITNALAPYGRDKKHSWLRRVSRRLPGEEAPSRAHFRVHDPAWKVQQKLGNEVFSRFTSFAVVRNPFEHAVSHYEYMKQFRISSTAKKVGQMSFLEYLKYRTKPPLWNDTIFARLPDQTYFLSGKSGELAVDRLVRFETLAEDFNSLTIDLGLRDVMLEHKNKTKSKSDKRPYQSYYDDESVVLVREIYKRDFDSLGYSKELPRND